MTTIAVTDTIRSFTEVESRFGLTRSLDPDFFSEWQQNFEPLTQIEKSTLDRIKHSYLRHINEGFLSEGVVNLLVVSPLLFLANFLDAPFSLRSEEAIEIVDQDLDITYKGRIDALVFKESIWIVLVEAKRSSFSFLVAVPQALTYMMASPNGDFPTYALVTNGDHFMFVKKHGSQYDLSDDFSLFKRSQNELYPVLQILKSLANI
ncbi:MAG TPA: type I restriction endonuclease subunit R [Pseudanabaena sp.]|nr:type I restriction endonuclease subunit R [Pseudanabaena sp.]